MEIKELGKFHNVRYIKFPAEATLEDVQEYTGVEELNEGVYYNVFMDRRGEDIKVQTFADAESAIGCAKSFNVAHVRKITALTGVNVIAFIGKPKTVFSKMKP